MVRTTTTPHAPPPLQPTQLVPFWERTGPGSCSLVGSFLLPLLLLSASWRHCRLLLIIGTGSRFLVIFPTYRGVHPFNYRGGHKVSKCRFKKCTQRTHITLVTVVILKNLHFLLHQCTLQTWAHQLQLHNFRTLSSRFRILNRGHECANKGIVLDRTNNSQYP